MFVSLPTIAKAWMFAWAYLAVGGWFSTYMLISEMGGTRRNDMIDALMPLEAFALTAAVMMISSLTTIGLFFYGRYARKKKDVAKAALKKYEETRVYIDPKMKFDPAVAVFWIGGSVLNVLFCLTLFIAVLKNTGAVMDPPIMYALAGFCISFFGSVLMYLITQFMANGILDAKAVKSIAKAILGSDETKKVIAAVCRKLGVADGRAVDRVYDAIRDKIHACEYSELTPDEVLLISKAIEESGAAGAEGGRTWLNGGGTL
jgi:hypothetical protein